MRRSGAATAAAAAAASAAIAHTGIIAHPPNVFPLLSPDTGYYNKQPPPPPPPLPPLPPLPPPPMDIMINSTSAAHASPAESTLTGNPPAAPKKYPPYMVLGTAESNDENVDDNDDDEDGDSYYDGDELKVHLLAVARRYADDEAGDKINSVADAERVVNSLTHHDEEIDDIDDDIGEPPLDEMEHGISPA